MGIRTLDVLYCPGMRAIGLMALAVIGAGVGMAMVAWQPAARAGHLDASPAAPTAPARLAPLHEREERLRKAWDFRGAPSGDRVTGPDPFALRALPGSGELVGILRG